MTVTPEPRRMGETDAMKASLNDLVRLLVDMPNDRGDRIIPKGSEGGVVECFHRPSEGYAVDFPIPDDRLVGGFDYENIIVAPDQFEVVDPARPAPKDA